MYPLQVNSVMSCHSIINSKKFSTIMSIWLCMKCGIICQFDKDTVTHMVPATLVLIWLFSPSSSLASPKSDILGFRSLSRSTLVALISLWTILILDSSWRKANPLAIPIQILSLVGQSRFGWPFSGPEKNSLTKLNIWYYLYFTCLNRKCIQIK